MFYGYPRRNGTAGVRNQVAVISLMDSCNGLARKIVENVRGTVLVTDLFGRKMQGTNHEMRLRAFEGMATNPNIGGVVLVTLHGVSAETFAAPIAAAGTDVETVAYQDFGSTLRSVEQGTLYAARMMKKCSGVQRTEQPLSKLVLGLECGGSDFTSGISGNPALGVAADMLLDAGGSVILSETAELMGAEHLLAARAVDKDTARRIVQAVADMEEMARIAGVPDIRRSNPAADNIKGGLTTLAEKALGAVRKAGSRPLQGVVDYCERVVPNPPGFYFMSTPAPACESMTGLAAGGAQIIAFNTGSGQPSSHPLAPTIKFTGNPQTASRGVDDLDLEVSDILTGAVSIEEAGKRIYDEVLAVANGRYTYTELYGTAQSTISVQGASF